MTSRSFPRSLSSRTALTALAVLPLLGAAPLQAAPVPTLDPCAIALSPHRGGTAADREILRWQTHTREADRSLPYLERLGWAYVAKARASLDYGYYTLAEQTADCLQATSPGAPEALLLRAHALHNLHRFREAEALARELVARRGLAYDYGLLGDLLMEQGQLEGAVSAYEQMMALRPSPEAYARAAHLRWLHGDLEGAIEAMRMALRGADPRAPEAAAWYAVRLGHYLWQAGDASAAAALATEALALQPDYPPALMLRGRLLLGQGRAEEALPSLTRAAAQAPLPEYLWMLAEALGVAGRAQDAGRAEAELMRRGATDDPRTLSLYLATSNRDPHRALRLARQELTARRDAHTLDAVAWALYAAGQQQAARVTLAEALSCGVADARLYLHAAVLAGTPAEAHSWLQRARPLAAMLLPSEQARLDGLRQALDRAASTANQHLVAHPMAANGRPGDLPDLKQSSQP